MTNQPSNFVSFFTNQEENVEVQLTARFGALGAAGPAVDVDATSMDQGVIRIMSILPSCQKLRAGNEARAGLGKQLTVNWQKANGIRPVLSSRRILTKTVPKRLNSRVTAAIRTLSSLESARLWKNVSYDQGAGRVGELGAYFATKMQASGG